MNNILLLFVPEFCTLTHTLFNYPWLRIFCWYIKFYYIFIFVFVLCCVVISNILLFLICLFCEMRKMFQVSLLHKFQRKNAQHFKIQSAWKIAKDWAILRWVIMICSCEKAQSQGTSFQFSRFTWIWNEYFAQISFHLVLRNNVFVCEPLSSS